VIVRRLVHESADRGLSPSPFDGLELPRLPERTDGSWPDERSEADLEHAFGDLRSLINTYLEHNGLDAEPDVRRLWNEVRWNLSESPPSRNRFVQDSPGSPHYEDAYFASPDTARAEIADIIGRLRAGFERLAAVFQG
jgi:hypothetical protein